MKPPPFRVVSCAEKVCYTSSLDEVTFAIVHGQTIMKTLLVALATLATVECFLEIHELSEMVTNANDRWQLRMLEHDRDAPRNEIQKKVAEIVSTQPQDVQTVYKKLVESDNAKEEAEYEAKLIILKNRGEPQSKLDFVKQVHEIEMDMSLSRRQEEQKIKELKWQMGGNHHHHGFDKSWEN
ncbi:hypothetical protein Tcan_05569 [Toxocara canis]|uniref:Uncharacterized protein n=1 Tax=Toxocara canis TaxID=6265 RepID=A0A0B2V534_TOXCA|nr:hypothetical protein Tcan_05569 [Toxocara canis]